MAAATGASATPSAPPIGPGPSGAPLTVAEQRLVGRVNASVLVGCASAKDSGTGDMVAAVNCRAAQPGPTKLPLVIQFRGVDAMNDWIGRSSAAITPVAGHTCPDGSYHDQWTSPATGNARAGQLVCGPAAAGGFEIMWSFDAAAVVVIADGTDGPSLYRWWTGNAYLITSS